MQTVSLLRWGSSDLMGVANSAGNRLEPCVNQEGSSGKLTTATNPQFNGVAHRALGLIETVAMAGRIQDPDRFPGTQLPATASLWAEGSHWAHDALNRTATTAIPESEPPHDVWHAALPR